MQRLKTRAQFQATMSAGTIARTPHFALHRMVLTQQAAAEHSADLFATGPGSEDPQALFGVGALREQAWLGAMVPKRWARRSVTRHTVKRQMYVVAAEHEAGLVQASYVVRLRAGFDRKQFVSATSEQLKAAVRAELQQLFASALRRLAAGDQIPSGAGARTGKRKNTENAAQTATQSATHSAADNAAGAGSEAES